MSIGDAGPGSTTAGTTKERASIGGNTTIRRAQSWIKHTRSMRTKGRRDILGGLTVRDNRAVFSGSYAVDTHTPYPYVLEGYVWVAKMVAAAAASLQGPRRELCCSGVRIQEIDDEPNYEYKIAALTPKSIEYRSTTQYDTIHT